MAYNSNFKLNLSSCQGSNCKVLTLTDTSGDTTTTPSTTWNDTVVPDTNPNISDIGSATIEVSLSSDSSVSYLLDVSSFFTSEYIGRVDGSLGGTIITGTNTTFLTDISAGNTIAFGPNAITTTYTVSSVDSDTQITLTTALLVNITNDWAFNLSSHPYDPANLIFDIQATDIGLALDSSLPDDVYNIIYTAANMHTGDSWVFETNIMLYCTIECCVYKKIQSIPSYYGCDSCDSTHINDALMAFSLLMSLESAARCGSADELTNILNILKKLCHYQPCIGCK